MQHIFLVFDLPLQGIVISVSFRSDGSVDNVVCLCLLRLSLQLIVIVRLVELWLVLVPLR